MDFPRNFISATTEYTTLDKFVPAPYFRKTFEVYGKTTAKLLICGLGFYQVYVNGENKTKGKLAPYIYNPDKFLYYDEYEFPLKNGKNVIGILLGNGFLNNPGGHVWDFDKADFRDAPKVALSLTFTDKTGKHVINSDKDFKCAPSPIIFDDYRYGEHYDARLEIKGWNTANFDDSKWQNAITAKCPSGTPKICDIEPIKLHEQLKPVSITKDGDGYLYDFGKNTSGVCNLKVSGAEGQKITMIYGEVIVNGSLNMDTLYNPDPRVDKQKYDSLGHRDVYICKGKGKETYTPTFVYHGARYVHVSGISEKQATENLLTFLVMYSDIKECGNFICSDPVVNKLQQITRNSDLTNFHYFPTDCPHREKNGWTGDIALSAEHMLFNLSAEKSLSEWISNLCALQREDGQVPAIVPTSGWGFTWGCGPAWDLALINVPYFVFKYKGDREILLKSYRSIYKYLQCLSTKINDKGLIAFGLGDWCQAKYHGSENVKSPLEFTDTVVSIDMARKSAFIFNVLNKKEEEQYALSLCDKLLSSARKNLLDLENTVAVGNCQTSQAMAIYYDIFSKSEKPKAFEVLLRLIKKENNLMDVGILGARVLFHVLTEFNRSDLAYDMIVGPKFPSYGHWLKEGATSLFEDFLPEGEQKNSLNHHFFGDISNWFMQALSGIYYNPDADDIFRVDIKPSFIPQLNFAKGFYNSPCGKIKVCWEKKKGTVILKVSVPEKAVGKIVCPEGYEFKDKTAEKELTSGKYPIVRK